MFDVICFVVFAGFIGILIKSLGELADAVHDMDMEADVW